MKKNREAISFIEIRASIFFSRFPRFLAGVSGAISIVNYRLDGG